MAERSLTHSSMSAFKTCPRKYYYAYELGIERDRVSQPLRMGSAVHLGLDWLAQGESLTAVMQGLQREYATLPPWATTQDDITEWMVESSTVIALVVGYASRWADDASEILATEQELEVPIRNPRTGGTARTTLRGKIDKLIRLPDGRLAIREHKTTSDDIGPDSDYWSRLSLDQQISTYVIAARSIGYDVTTVEYDVIRKPSIRPRKPEYQMSQEDRRALNERGVYFGLEFTLHEVSDAIVAGKETPAMYGARLVADTLNRPDWYYARREIPRLESDIEEYRAELWQTHRIISECRVNGWWFRNSAACLAPYRCEFCDICFTGSNVNEEIPQGFRLKERKHMELGGNNDNATNESAAETTTEAADEIAVNR